MNPVTNGQIESDAAYGHATHPGLVRDHNEDCYRVVPELGVWILADGMGGHESGEVASAITVEQVARSVAGGESLSDALIGAHQAVLAAPKLGRGKRGMGATVVVLQLRDESIHIAWVGDSRAYLWDGQDLSLLTRDHSLVQQLLDSGSITEEYAQKHPGRNIITQAIGALDIPDVEVDEIQRPFRRGEKVLLCSDGLSDEVPEARIREVLATSASDQQAVDALIQATLERGAKDNVTVLLVSAPSDERAPQANRAAQPPASIDGRGSEEKRTSFSAQWLWLLLGALVAFVVLWMLW